MAWKRHVQRQGGMTWQAKHYMIWSQCKQNVMKLIKNKISIFMLDISISLCWCTGFKRGTEPCCFARGCLIICMTFMNFPKPGVKFHVFSRPRKRKWNSMTFPGFPWLDTPCIHYQSNKMPPPIKIGQGMLLTGLNDASIKN